VDLKRFSAGIAGGDRPKAGTSKIVDQPPNGESIIAGRNNRRAVAAILNRPDHPLQRPAVFSFIEGCVAKVSPATLRRIV
jgi:hypothetical protein